MSMISKPIVWLAEMIKSPPLSPPARIEAGMLLRRVQDGEKLGMPASRPMPSIGPRCHELRVNDATRTWRVIYRVDPDAIVVAMVFDKKTRATAPQAIETAKSRLARYDADAEQFKKGLR
jgi:phage-related protein